MIDEFQKPDNNKRLIIGNLKVMCNGIDLDDKYGNFPRYAFVSPTFSAIDLYQFSCRFLRSSDSKSHTTIRYMFSKHGIPSDFYQKLAPNGIPDHGIVEIPTTGKNKADNQERKILLYLAQKGDVMKKISSENTIFPNEFDAEVLLFGNCMK